jgi:hypothetical protein
VQSFKGHDRSKISKIIVHGRALLRADFATRPRQHNNHLKHLKIANVVAATIIAMVSFVHCDDWLEGTDEQVKLLDSSFLLYTCKECESNVSQTSPETEFWRLSYFQFSTSHCIFGLLHSRATATDDAMAVL